MPLCSGTSFKITPPGYIIQDGHRNIPRYQSWGYSGRYTSRCLCLIHVSPLLSGSSEGQILTQSQDVWGNLSSNVHLLPLGKGKERQLLAVHTGEYSLIRLVRRSGT